MSVAEMRIEVINKITSMESEAVLKEVLQVLKTNEAKPEADNLSQNYQAIKQQYGDVLQKLAQ